MFVGVLPQIRLWIVVFVEPPTDVVSLADVKAGPQAFFSMHTQNIVLEGLPG